MREKLINIFSKIIEGGIIILVFLLPLFFLPITSEAFEFPKQILFLFLISLLTIAWAIKMILEKSVKILHSPLTLPILIFFGVFLLATIFSIHRFSSIFGPYPRLYGGLISLIICLLTFFLVANNVKEKKQISRIFIALSLSGLVLVVISLFNFFDVYLLGKLLRGRFLTPAGSADGTSLFLVLILPVLLLTFFFEKKRTLKILSGAVSFIFIFYIFLINYLFAVFSVFLIFLLAIIFSKLTISREMLIKMGIFFLICLFLVTINNWDLVRTKVPLLKTRLIQHDIALDQNTGWAVAVRGLQNLKFLALGSGPGTYLFDFTSFKPIGFNQTPLWNIRFEKSSNEYFQIISTIGFLGFLSFLYLLLIIGKIARLIWQKKEELGQICLFPVILFAFISLFTASFTLTAFVFWLFLGLTIAFSRLINLTKIREVELSLATVQLRGRAKVRGELFPWLIGLVVILILIPLLWQEGRLFQAELYFTKARAEQFKAQPNGDLILQSLTKAREIMPTNDYYRQALSDTSLNFTILAEQQRLLTEESKQQLLQTAVTEGQWAVRLAPHNIFNWENLQQIYTTVTVSQQEDLLINTVLPQEILLDPFNPRHWNDLGWIHFNLRNDIDTAKWYLQKAISLKTDLPDAHYNLARVYTKEGKKERALQEYEQALNFLSQQISSLEAVLSSRPDLQEALSQLKQFRFQIEAEREQLLQEIDKEQSPKEE